MSLSKRFPLYNLPLLPLEQVILQLNPMDLFLCALSSEKAIDLIGSFSLLNYFDILKYSTTVEFLICFKSGKPLRWRFFLKLPINASEKSRDLANREFLDGRKGKIGVFQLDDMKMDLWETGFEIRSQVPKEHFVDYTQRIGYLFQSICPGQQIRYLGAGRVGREDENVSFHMDRITRCEEFSFEMYDQDNFLEILEKMDVNWKINLKCNRRNDEELEWMNNEKIRNIPELKLRYFENLDFSQILKLENEHLHLEYCKMNGSVVNAFLKKWMNGEFTKKRTLRVTGDYGADDKVWDGLTKEPLETWEKLGESKRRLVRFSYKLCLNPTPRTVPGSYQTVLLKNCHGQFATVIEAKNQFFFTPWHHPLPPIGIPEGFKLRESFESPFARIVAQNF